MPNLPHPAYENHEGQHSDKTGTGYLYIQRHRNASSAVVNYQNASKVSKLPSPSDNKNGENPPYVYKNYGHTQIKRKDQTIHSETESSCRLRRRVNQDPLGQLLRLGTYKSKQFLRDESNLHGTEYKAKALQHKP